MHLESKVITWIQEDEMRMNALSLAASLNLNDWCIAAGFVRNLIWDKLHGYTNLTSLNDIDLIYFDKSNSTVEVDLEIESTLKFNNSSLPWSVKNQARMHLRNNDRPYNSASDAMSYWVEVETAIGARLSKNGEIELVAPFGLDHSFANTVTVNSKRIKLKEFEQRVKGKRWLKLWPKLEVMIA